jgi:hypothetical protein
MLIRYFITKEVLLAKGAFMVRSFIFALVAVLLLPMAAFADFGDCRSPGYLGLFPDAADAHGLDCVEIFNFSYSSPSGERSIRAIKDLSGGWAFASGAEAEVERASRLAAAAFSDLGSYDIDDVTILFLDAAHDFSERPRRIVLAMTDGRGGVGGGRAGECLITLYALSPSADLAVTVAHEIFHCLQFRSLTSAQMATTGVGGSWWVEGSAELFAAYTIPESGPSTDRSSRFDANVSAGMALNEMAHDASIFFYWLQGRRGLSALMPFMRAMADSGSASAQRAAMRGALSNADWLQFAQDYADRAIKHPQDYVLDLNPSDDVLLTITESDREQIRLEPFALKQGVVTYACGAWRNTVRRGAEYGALRRESETAWGPYPETIDTETEGELRYRFAAMLTDDTPLQYEVEIERTRSCELCGATDEVDICLVGTWKMTGGGPEAWMRANGINIRVTDSGPRIVTYRDDGIYGTPAFGLNTTMRAEDLVAEGEGFVTSAAGRWSAKDGMLNVCQDSGMMSGEVEVTMPSGTSTMPVSQPGAGMITQRYVCSARSLSTTLSFGGMSPMRTEFTKISE